MEILKENGNFQIRSSKIDNVYPSWCLIAYLIAFIILIGGFIESMFTCLNLFNTGFFLLFFIEIFITIVIPFLIIFVFLRSFERCGIKIYAYHYEHPLTYEIFQLSGNIDEDAANIQKAVDRLEIEIKEYTEKQKRLELEEEKKKEQAKKAKEECCNMYKNAISKVK